jgi:hypothetical protein
MTETTKPKRNRRKPEAQIGPVGLPKVEDRSADLRHSEVSHREMAIRGSRMLLAALARSGFMHGVLLRDMTPDEQLAAARLDGWRGPVIGSERWGSRRRPDVVWSEP